MIGFLGREWGVVVLVLGLVGRKWFLVGFVIVLVGIELVVGILELDFFFDDMIVLGL